MVQIMKGVGALVVAVTALTSAFSSSITGDRVCTCCPAAKPESRETRISQDARGIAPKSLAEDIFAPRFDGLRFIETLITAHR